MAFEEKRKREIAKKFAAWMEDLIQDRDYSEIDGFCMDNGLTDDEVNFVLNLPLKVSVK